MRWLIFHPISEAVSLYNKNVFKSNSLQRIKHFFIVLKIFSLMPVCNAHFLKYLFYTLHPCILSFL